MEFCKPMPFYEEIMNKYIQQDESNLDMGKKVTFFT